MCSNAPVQGDDLCLSTCLGLQETQAEDPPKQALRARASRHKMTCRKKTVVTAVAAVFSCPTSASRPKAKRSRPAASLKQEGAGKDTCLETLCPSAVNSLLLLNKLWCCCYVVGAVSGAVTSADCAAANKGGQRRSQKVAEQVQRAADKKSALSGRRTRQKDAKIGAPKTKSKTETKQSVRPQKKQKTAPPPVPAAVPPVPEAGREHVHEPGATEITP